MVEDHGTNDCGDPVGAYGPRADVVLATACGGDVHVTYAWSPDDWGTHVLEARDGIVLLGPQVAVDGDRLFVAASAYADEDGGCGGDGLREAGVMIWSRLLPDGVWTEPTRIGGPHDRLESFRVVGGAIHATVRDDETGAVAYIHRSAGLSKRLAIVDAVSTSLRVGSDGVARVAYTTSNGLYLATMDGSAHEARRIYRGSDAHGPMLVLAEGNQPILMWTVEFRGGGCAEPEPLPHHGTYVFSDVQGVIASERLSPSSMASSLTLDIPGGTVYAVISEYADDRRGTYLWSRSIAGSEWTSVELDEGVAWPLMRVDQATGQAFLAWTTYDDDTQRLMVQTADLR